VKKEFNRRDVIKVSGVVFASGEWNLLDYFWRASSCLALLRVSQTPERLTSGFTLRRFLSLAAYGPNSSRKESFLYLNNVVFKKRRGPVLAYIGISTGPPARRPNTPRHGKAAFPLQCRTCFLAASIPATRSTRKDRSVLRHAPK